MPDKLNLGILLLTMFVILSPTVSHAQTDSTSLTQEQVQHMRDSVYAIINQNFQEVRHIFEHSCFNCHSDQTDFPWYYKLPLIKSLLNSDIKEARDHIDMSDGFPFKGEDPQLIQLKHLKHEIQEGDMPPWDYRLMHWNMLIEGARQDSVFQWIDTSRAQLTRFFSAAGLEMPSTSEKDDMEAEDEE